MKYVIALALVFIGYTVGILFGDYRTVNEQTAMSYIKGHDVGCDEIVRRHGDLVCEVKMQAEDDKLYIVRGE